MPKTGDAANMLFYVSKDDGAVTVIASNSGVPTEIDATNAKGWYKISLSQAETNGDKLLFSGKSSTSNISVVGGVLYTTPNRFTTLVIDAAGLADANAVKVGPSGSGTAQTARDIGASVITASVSVGGIVAASFAASAIDSAAIAASGASKISSAVWDETRASHISAGTFGAGVKTTYPLAKNTALAKFPFVMTLAATHAPVAGLTVTAQRSIDGAAFGACTNVPVSVGNGAYTIDLSAADLNGTTIELRFTEATADDRLIGLVLQQP